MPTNWKVKWMDNSFNKYDPHAIAETKMKAIISYREAKRMFNQLQSAKVGYTTSYDQIRLMHQDIASKKKYF